MFRKKNYYCYRLYYYLDEDGNIVNRPTYDTVTIDRVHFHVSSEKKAIKALKDYIKQTNLPRKSKIFWEQIEKDEE